jgi:hypothetical protein
VLAGDDRDVSGSGDTLPVPRSGRQVGELTANFGSVHTLSNHNNGT